MALTPTQQGIRWSIVLLATLLVVYLLRGVLTPYLIALALGYFLDPLADALERRGVRRIWAVVLITIAASTVVIGAILLVVPLLISQGAAFFHAVPSYFASIQEFVATRFPQFSISDLNLAERLQGFAADIGRVIADVALTSSQTIFGIIGAFVIIPVVSFFILLDWDRMVAAVNRWLPLDYADEIRYVLREIDKTLASFVRGQGSVCLIMAVYYATILGLFGLNFGVALGVTAGILTFIPYVGAFIPGVLVIAVGLAQFWGDWVYMAIMFAFYFGGQSVEGNFLSPKLVGNAVQLHPVWILFALSAFGFIFGFAGLMIAVPVAATIGVVGRYTIGKYRRGKLYLGRRYAVLAKDDETDNG